MATRVTLGCKHESEVATYRVVVADLVNSTVHHACKIWILQAKEEKQGELEMTTVYVVCTNSKVHTANVYTQSSQKSRCIAVNNLTIRYHSYLLNYC